MRTGNNLMVQGKAATVRKLKSNGVKTIISIPGEVQVLF
jgi:hypothetical protein